MRGTVLLLLLSAVVGACGASHRQTRWEPYPGCDASQCQTWFEACRAECLNEGGEVGTCQTTCRTKRDACSEGCGGS